MFDVLSDISITLLDISCLWIFLDAVFPSADNDSKKSRTYIYYFVYAVLFIADVEMFSENFFIKEILILFITSLMMKSYKRITLLRSLVASFVFLMIMIIVDFLALYSVYILFEQFDSTAIGDTLTGRFIVLIGKNGLFIVTLFIKMRTSRRRGLGMMETDWLRYVFFPVCTIMASVAMAVGFRNIVDRVQSNVLLTIAFGLVIMNVYIYFIIDDVIKREIRIRERELEYAQFRNQVEIYNMLEDGLERQRRYAHEFKNHILCIDTMIKDKDYVTLEKYVSKISGSKYVERKIIDTNNMVVNTILNEKYYEMDKKGIAFVFRVNDLSGLAIEDDDIVVILSNLINNAIEACDRIAEGERIIRLKFMTEDDAVVLSVRNTYGGKVVTERGRFVTTKPTDTEEHGIGIKNIRHVVKKYGGTCSVRYSGNDFYIALLFPLDWQNN